MTVHLIHSPLRARLHRGLLVIIALGFLCAAVLPFLPSDSDLAEEGARVATTAGSVLLYGFCAYCSMLPMEKSGLRIFSIVGVAVSIICLLLTVYYVWFGANTDLGIDMLFSLFTALKQIATFSVFALTFAATGVLLRLNVRTTIVKRLRAITISALGLLCILILLVMIGDTMNLFLFRLITLAYIVGVFGTLTTLYSHELSRYEYIGLEEDDAGYYGHQSGYAEEYPEG